jgi:Polyketide cyclase / dehydrase and lipid transport
MATYRTEIDSPRSPGDVFEYLATFSNARDWDPSVAEAEPLSAGRAEIGSMYRLGVRAASRVVPLDYEVVALDRPHRVVLEARRAGLVSSDTITVEPLYSGSRVRYVAVLQVRGLLRVVAPLIDTVFGKMADRAAAGLQRRLA